MLLPLCDELGITVNDLLSGEIVPREDYQKKAENNMVEMIREREANKKQFTLTLLLGGVSLAAFLTLLIVVCVYTDVIPLTVKLILLAIACVIFTVGVTAVMEGQRKIGYYQCEKCGETFVPGFRTHLLGFNMVSRRFMKCPCCQKRAWCRKVMEKAQK